MIQLKACQLVAVSQHGQLNDWISTPCRPEMPNGPSAYPCEKCFKFQSSRVPNLGRCHILRLEEDHKITLSIPIGKNNLEA